MTNSWVRYLPGGEQIATLVKIEAVALEIKRLQDYQKSLELQAEETASTVYTISQIRNAQRQAQEMAQAA